MDFNSKWISSSTATDMAKRQCNIKQTKQNCLFFYSDCEAQFAPDCSDNNFAYGFSENSDDIVEPDEE
jgi:hypothetical protein